MNHQIDVAPVNSQIQRRSRDHRPEFIAPHRSLHPPPLRRVQGAMMQRDRQAVVVDPPQLLKQQLRLAAGIDEDQRGAVILDGLVDVGNRVARRMPRPGNSLLAFENRDQRAGSAGNGNPPGHIVCAG